MARTLDEIVSGDFFDSREIIERITELEEENSNDEGEFEWTDEDAQAEYEGLIEIKTDAEGYAEDWEYGVTFIRDSNFEAYAEELAEDIGAISRDAAWPLNRIDWEAAANDLKMDYTSVEIDGEDWWYR